jgi:2-hydroxychromene-2-carboxylate isomerase
MSKTIEIYYSFQSPFSYLALDALYEIERNFDVEFIWQPFSAKASGQQTTSHHVVVEKISYLFESTKRYALHNNIPLVFPEDWPKEEFDPSKVTRGALVARDMEVLMEYNYKVFHKIWGTGENPNDEGFMQELCDELDIELGEFLSKMSSSDTRERVKNIYKRGRKFEVFDTPTLIMDSQRYVGLEILPFLCQILEKEGLKK